jgi:hypothetical protein
MLGPAVTQLKTKSCKQAMAQVCAFSSHFRVPMSEIGIFQQPCTPLGGGSPCA